MFLSRSHIHGKLNIGFISYSVYRRAKILDKLINKGKVKKNQNLKSNQTATLAQEVFPLRNHVCTRRMAVLNKTFMTHITGIMMCGKNSADLQGLGIEVTKVQIDPSLQNMRVYWISSEKELDVNVVSNILNKTAGELQYEISSLRFMGRWPEIKFVRDISFEKQFEAENILRTLDLGEKSNSDADVSNDTLPKMRHDIFGLDHSAIMRRLMAEIGRNKAIGIEPVTDSSPRNSDNCSNLKSKQIPFDKKAFTKFYKKQQIMMKKLSKLEESNNFNSLIEEINNENENWNVLDEFNFDDIEEENYETIKKEK